MSPDLFDAEAEANRITRRRDPMTSYEAALGLIKSGSRDTQHKRIIRAMLHGLNGATSAELEEMFANAGTRIRAHKRMPELERDGIIRRGAPRTCKSTGEHAMTWWLK